MCFLFAPTFPVCLSHTVYLAIFCPHYLYLPEKVAAEDEAEHEDKEANAQHNDIDIEREVVDVRRHAAVVFRALRTQTTQASCHVHIEITFLNFHYIANAALTFLQWKQKYFVTSKVCSFSF